MPPSALGLNYAQSTLLLITAGAVMLFVLVVSSFKLSSETGARADEIAQERLVRIAARQMQIGLLNAESGQRGYLVTGEVPYLEPYFEGVDEVRRGLSDMEQRIINAEDRARLDRIKSLIAAKLQEMEMTVGLVKSGRRDEAIKTVKNDRGLTYMNELRTQLEAITGRADSAIGQGLAALTTSARRLTITTTLGSMLLVGFAAVAFYIVANNTGQLVTARQSLEDLTNELEERVKDRTLALTQANDEIQRFAYIVSHDLRAPLVNIMGFTSELESASGQLATYFRSEQPSDAEKKSAADIATADIPEVGQVHSVLEHQDGRPHWGYPEAVS